MNPGDTLRFRGPAGAPFVVTVGAAFAATYIQARIDAGEWTPEEVHSAPEETPEEPEGAPNETSRRRPGRPRKNP